MRFARPRLRKVILLIIAVWATGCTREPVSQVKIDVGGDDALAIEPEELLTVADDEPGVVGVVLARPVVKFECRWTHLPIKIDGNRDDAAWKHAQEIGPFLRSWKKGAEKKPHTAAKAWLLWDREYLYFAADMEDSDVYADVKEHDGQTWSNDVFELFLKPADDKSGYYEFQVNALGTQMDVFFPRRGAGGFDRFKDDIEFHIESKVVVRGTINRWQDKDQGWTVEGRIGWRDFLRTGGRPVIDEKWKFALCRYDYSVDFEGPDLSTIAPLSAVNFHRYEDYAELRFVGPQETPPPDDMPLGIAKYVPLTTSRVVGSPDPPLPYRPKKAYPKLKLNYPVVARHVPGTNHLLFFDQPWAYRPTALRRMKDDPATDSFETLLGVDKETVAYDICFHPDYKNNGYVYIGSNGAGPDGLGGKKHSRVTRYHLDPKPPHKFDADSATVIIEWPSDGHNGAAIAFGPDRMMYVTSGDGTGSSDKDVVGQRLDLLLSKVLRIDVDKPAEGKMYSVPKDNPFVGRKNVRPETWAYGLRNPWRIAIDQENGNIWVGNNGQDLYEQIYLVKRGANFGWGVYEGSHLFYPKRKLGPTPVTMPIFEHHHTVARSLTGGVIYRGQKLPELRGAYLYGDYSTGRIWGALHDGEKVVWHKELADTTFNITGFAVDKHGELLVLDHHGYGQGNFYHLEPTPQDVGGQEFPRELSETGLFRSVARHEVEPALIPYSVNVPHWADGAFQIRYLGLPGENPKITFQPRNVWSFPDETVLVKSLGLELEEGNPDSRRWIETQLLTKQQDEWTGYTYAWNDEGTDATLVDRGGTDWVFEIKTADGVRKHAWHFASRSECMSCHNRAVGNVLGIWLFQMNRDHDYGEVKDKQLRTIEQLGVLKVNWHGGAIQAVREELKADGQSDEEARKRIRQLTATRDQRTAKTSTLLARPPEKLARLVNFDDEEAPLDARVRSYLHANCAHCHIRLGGGNAQIQLDFFTARERMKLIGVKPIQATFDLPGAKLVVPGDPYRSVLYYRLSTVGSGRMPRIGSHVVDKKALAMIRKWIEDLPRPSDDVDEEERQIQAARQEEQATIAVLSRTTTAGNPVSDKIDKLLETTSGALALLDVVEEGKLPAGLCESIVAKATSHERVQTRDLFERFLPPDERTQRLGTKIDPEQILALEGDADRGRALFAGGTVANCKSCHRLGEGPAQLGPDLAEIGKKLKREELLESLLNPSKKIDEKYQTYIVDTLDGKTHTGLIVKQDENQVVLRNGDNKEQLIARTKIDEMATSPVSLMPEGLYRDMTAQQLADLLALLEAAK